MVHQEDFLVERWMDEFETSVSCNIAETCCASLSLAQVAAITGRAVPVDALTSVPLTYGVIPGSAAARAAIAAIYNESAADADNDGAGEVPVVSPEDVLVSNGAIGANFLAYYALVGPGDHVVVVDPLYQQLQSVPRMFGAEVTLLRLEKEQQYLPEPARIAALLRDNTKLVIINSPHNPTGAVISTARLREIVRVVRESRPHDPPYIHCDEVYRPVFFGENEGADEAEGKGWPLSIVHLYERGVSTSSATKAYGLAGLRFGWLASRDAGFIEECLKRRDYNTISVSLVDDLLAAWALGSGGWRRLVVHHMRAVCRPNLALLDAYVAASNGAVAYTRPRGGTVVLLRITGVDDTVAFCREFIAAKSTLIVPGETFNSPGYVRIGFANSPESLATGLERLKEYLIEKRYVASPWHQ